MDVKNKPSQNSHIHTLTKSLISRLPLTLITYPAVFLLSALLSRSTFLGSASPFGLAVAAALGTSKFSLLGLLGAALGYVSVSEKINALKYIACLILVFTAHFVFSGTSLVKKKYFTPISVVIPALCINFVFLADGGFSVFDTALSLFEVLVAAICSSLFAPLRYLDSGSAKISVYGLIALAVALCSALSSFCFLNLLCPGRIFALLFILLLASSRGFGGGAAGGLIFGSAVSFSLISPEYGIVFGFCGILSSAVFPFGKFISLPFAYLAAGCICACLNPSLILSFAVEFPLAAGLFLLFETPFSKLCRRFFPTVRRRTDAPLRRYATERLAHAADAFRALSNTLSEFYKKDEPRSLSDVRLIFEKSAGSFCKKCTLRPICWDRDFSATKDAFSKAGDSILKNGVLSARDFPVYFSSRCLNTENFVNSANREIFAMRYRTYLEEQHRNSRELLKKQYSDIASVFSGLSLDISDNARFDEQAESEISDILTRRGILCDTSAYRDSENHINIHLCGRDLTAVMKNQKEFLPLFEKATSTRLTEPEFSTTKDLDDIVIRQLPRFKAHFGAAVRSRTDSGRSGDSGSLIFPSNGHLALLLSDGMGSGRLAAAESAGSVKLLSELLHGGLSPKDALSSLQSALTLRSEALGSFSTLDLLAINLFTGSGEIYKFGGAPTYIKRGKDIRRITSSSLPAGISLSGKNEPDFTPLSLSGGEYIIMTSDGIADGADDVKLLEFLSEMTPAAPKDLADKLLAFSLAYYKKNDDMTVAAILIENVY